LGTDLLALFSFEFILEFSNVGFLDLDLGVEIIKFCLIGVDNFFDFIFNHVEFVFFLFSQNFNKFMVVDDNVVFLFDVSVDLIGLGEKLEGVVLRLFEKAGDTFQVFFILDVVVEFVFDFA
jgi:hypothetical protein